MYTFQATAEKRTPFEVLLRSGVNTASIPGRPAYEPMDETRLAVHRPVANSLKLNKHFGGRSGIKASDRPLADGSYVGRVVM